MIGIIIITLASAIDGILEGYGFDSRRSFERKYGVDTLGFWGSLSWKGKKTFGQTWDFYHIADDLRKYGYILGAILIGLNWTIIIAILLSIVSKRFGVIWIRK